MSDFEITDRGFKHFEPVVTSYGHHVSVSESSAAMAPHLWLKIEQTEESAAAAHSNIEPGKEIAHLTLDQGMDLIDRLTDAMMLHYQGLEDDELNTLAGRLERAAGRVRNKPREQEVRSGDE